MVDLDECTPVAEDAVTNLTSAEAYDYLSKAGSGKLQLSAVPPVQPKAGSVYVYDLGDDSDTWEASKRKLRFVQSIQYIAI